MEVILIVNTLVHTIIVTLLAVLSTFGIVYGSLKHKAMKKRVSVEGIINSVDKFRNYSYSFSHPLKGGVVNISRRTVFSFLHKAGDTVPVRVVPRNMSGEVDLWYNNGKGIVIVSSILELLALVGAGLLLI